MCVRNTLLILGFQICRYLTNRIRRDRLFRSYPGAASDWMRVKVIVRPPLNLGVRLWTKLIWEFSSNCNREDITLRYTPRAFSAVILRSCNGAEGSGFWLVNSLSSSVTFGRRFSDWVFRQVFEGSHYCFRFPVWKITVPRELRPNLR